MQPIGKTIQSFMPVLTLDSDECDSYLCEGCGQLVIVHEMTILGGPRKGQRDRIEKGCLCWEIEQGKIALKNQEKLSLKHMFDNNSLINPDLQNATFDNYEPTNEILYTAKNVAMDYVNSFDLTNPKNLLFGGKYGLGKSHLSAAICKGIQEKGFTTIFISVPKLLTKIRSTYNKQSEFTEAQLLDVLAKVDCLALDDIGAEKTKKEEEGESWAVEKLFEIIDSRSGKHTIYTTNLSSDELSKKVGPRNFSRMMMNTKPFKFEGDDYRIKNKRF